MKIVFFPSSPSFRTWLETHHRDRAELWIGFYQQASGKPSITYPEALDEALCFGWIDGVRQKVAADSYTVRFTPRTPKSQWSAVNIRHVKRLTGAGRMHPTGLKAFAGAQEQSRTYSYEQRNAASFDQAAERSFRHNRKAWEYFQAQPAWYRRTATFWVVSAKKDETRKKRLATLIADSAHERWIKPLARKPTTRSAVPKWQKKKT
jgi:uncharacterized protein YdeI (YjbR/CyaY-like superfamily)